MKKNGSKSADWAAIADLLVQVRAVRHASNLAVQAGQGTLADCQMLTSLIEAISERAEAVLGPVVEGLPVEDGERATFRVLERIPRIGARRGDILSEEPGHVDAVWLLRKIEGLHTTTGLPVQAV